MATVYFFRSGSIHPSPVECRSRGLESEAAWQDFQIAHRAFSEHPEDGRAGLRALAAYNRWVLSTRHGAMVESPIDGDAG